MKINDNKQRLKTYKIKNHNSGKTYSVKAVSYTDAKMKYNEYITNTFIEDNSFDPLFQFTKELKDLSYNSDEQTIRSVFLKAETIAKQVENSFRGLSTQFKTKLENWRKNVRNNIAATQHFAVEKVINSVSVALRTCADFFKPTERGQITKVLGQRFGNRTDKYLSLAKKYHDRFSQLLTQFSSLNVVDLITEDSLIEDAYVYPTNASTSMALSFAKLCVEKFGGKVASRNGNKYVYVAPDRSTAEKAKRFLETEYSSITFIVKDSLTEDALTVGYSFTNPKDATLYTVVKFKANSKGLFNALLKTKSGKYCVTSDLRHTPQGTSFNTATQFGYDIESATERFHHSNAKDSLTEDADEMGYVFEVLSGAFYSYVFAKSAKEAKEEYERITGHKATSVEKRGGKVSRTSSLAKNKCINVNDSITEDYVNKFFDDPNDFTYKGYVVLATYRYNASLRKNEIDKYAIMGPNGKYLFTAKTPEQAKRAIDNEIKRRMNDADIAQNDIKSTYLPEDANADNIRYLGFNEKRKLSFYSYGDRYFVYHDLEGRTEEIDKETVQKILKKNIFGEIDENDLINKEPQSDEIVTEKKQESGDR